MAALGEYDELVDAPRRWRRVAHRGSADGRFSAAYEAAKVCEQLMAPLLNGHGFAGVEEGTGHILCECSSQLQDCPYGVALTQAAETVAGYTKECE